jgi:hypothetical protein
MTEYSFPELRKLQRDLSHLIKQFPELDRKFDTFIGQFKELIMVVPHDHVPHYVCELFLKVSVYMDLLDTLEFGRLRSKHLLDSHEKYIFSGRLGSFDRPNQFEVGLKLSSCSHDGIMYCLNKFKVQCYFNICFVNKLKEFQSREMALLTGDDREALEIEVNSFGSTMAVIGDVCFKTRAAIVKKTRETFVESLSARGDYIGAHAKFAKTFNNFYGFVCEFARKAAVVNKKRITVRNFTITMFKDMLTAQNSGRALFVEFVDNIIPAPNAEYSHDLILVNYKLRVESEVAFAERAKLAVERSKAASDYDIRCQKEKSLMAERVVRENYERMSPEEKQAYDAIMSEGRRLAQGAISTQAKSDSASESELSEEEDAEDDKEPQIGDSTSSATTTLKKRKQPAVATAKAIVSANKSLLPNKRTRRLNNDRLNGRDNIVEKSAPNSQEKVINF